MTDYRYLRERMVDRQIRSRGVVDPLVLKAMAAVPRERFVLPEWRSAAYDDHPLPIAGGQTISQPYIVAYMVEALELKGGERVLEVGAGSGYAAAVLAEIAAAVFAIERVGDLAAAAADCLAKLGYANIHLRHADDLESWRDEGPFDAILVSAAARHVPDSLTDQLAPNGRLVIPVGEQWPGQELLKITRGPQGELNTERLAGVRFVPLIESGT